MERTVRVRLLADVSDFLSKIGAAGNAAVQNADKITKATLKNRRSVLDVSRAFLGIGVAAEAGVVYAIKKASDFDAAMSQVGATGEDARANIDALREAALAAGREFGQFTAIDAAQGITELEKAGVSAADVLGGALHGALALAATDNMAVGDAAQYTATSLAQFHLKGDQATHVADLLAAGAGKAVGSVTDMAQALSNGGTVAAQYGVSIEETVGTLSYFAQNAIIGADAGTAMKSMLLQLAQPTKKASEVMRRYGIDVYDANGQFVGMAGLADQLQDKLGGLSQEQQNAALKTMFGTYAIRAATLMMQGGGAAIRKWTGEVNDQGYAAETAAKKMDNLQGDLRALQGAFENLMINAGSGSQGPLRKMTQGLTGLIDAANNHPEAAQRILVLAAALGGVAVTLGGLMRITVAVSEFRAALSALGVTDAIIGNLKGAKRFFADVKSGSGAARASLIKFGIATAVLAAAAIAADQYGKAVSRSMEQARTKTNDYVSMISRGQTTFRDQFTATEGVVIKSTTSMGDTIKRALDPTGVQQFGDAFNSTFLGTSQVDEITKSFGQLDQALVQVDPKKAQEVFRGVQKEAADAGVETDKLVQLFPQYTGQLRETAKQLNINNLTNQDYVDWMGGKIPQAIKSAMVQQQLGTAAAQGLGLAMDDQTKAFEAAQEAANADAKAVRDAANAALQASGSQIGYQAAVDDATDALKKNGKTLDIHTEKGRANRAALDTIASSALAMVEAEGKAGAGTDQLRKDTKNAHDQFVKTAHQMGMNATDAENLANHYGLVPDLVATQFETPGADAAKKAAERYDKSIRVIPGQKRTAIVSTYDGRGVSAARWDLKHLHDKTIKVNTIYYSTRQTAQGGPGAASGFQADGSILRFFANGGFRENHVAQIAPAGAWRVWAEDETGGEAYIPLGVGKRQRSMAILEEVARLFGRQLTANANGNLFNAQVPSFQPSTVYSIQTPGRQDTYAMFTDNQVGTLARAMLQQALIAASSANRPLLSLLTGLPTASKQG